jgi:hypothetical protein
MDESGGLVFVEGCYGALCGTRGFEPPADPTILDIRPAGVMLWKMFMPSTVPYRSAVGDRIWADDRVDRRRDALVEFGCFVSNTASFHSIIQPGGHVIADGSSVALSN